jgi:hypothetical protein
MIHLSSHIPEVCRQHLDSECKVCNLHNDDLWVHPRDLPPAHEDCPLCQEAVSNRKCDIDQLQARIDVYREEIAEIERGSRHSDYHERVQSRRT